MAAPTLDGNTHGQQSGGGNMTMTLTTTKSNDIIVVEVYNELNAGAAAVSGITCAGVASFVQRSRSNGTSNGSLEIWWGVAASPLTAATITVSFAATYDNASGVAFGVNGCNTSSPWDANASLPKKASFPTNGQVPSVSGVSTSSAATYMITCIGAVSGPSSTPPTGWTFIDLDSNGGGSFQSAVTAHGLGVTSTQSSITITSLNDAVNAFGAATAGGEMIVEALVSSSGAPPPKPFFRGTFGALGGKALLASAGLELVRRNPLLTRRGLILPF